MRIAVRFIPVLVPLLTFITRILASGLAFSVILSYDSSFPSGRWSSSFIFKVNARMHCYGWNLSPDRACILTLFLNSPLLSQLPSPSPGVMPDRVFPRHMPQVTMSSLNRHAVANREDVGTPKAICLEKHLRGIVPEVRRCIDGVELCNGTGG